MEIVNIRLLNRMADIPSWFWMLVVAGLSGMLGLIMYYIALLLRETMLTVREFKYIVVEFRDILDSTKALMQKVNRMSDTMATTIETISGSILKPIAVVGTWVNSIKSVIEQYTGLKSGDVTDSIDEAVEEEIENGAGA